MTSGPAFQSISSPLGDSPFDKALCNRDKIVFGYIQKINRLVRSDINSVTDPVLSDSFGNEVIAACAAEFPGLGGFASGGGPLS